MTPTFFKINLNKFGELKQQIAREKKNFFKTAIVFLVGLVIFTSFVAFVNVTLNQKIDNRRDLLNQIKSEIKKYQVSGDYLSSNDLARLAKTSTERIFWAKKLVALSEKTDDKIAITHFSFKDKTLTLYGITKMDRDQQEHDLIYNFIGKLKDNAEISDDFPEIKFIKSRRDFEKDVEIIRFQIDCIKSDKGGK
ncbi:MAG: hypothetical protein HN952_06695 [Candidatus Cloacimonetes bacterium]|jgi:hypothetical protein|nr:hypothetical protein [Candidatus Cloacimonadota bacterium]MBT6994622.1 hypothetical protein [Candidatus Cloacimonadota bacterium]MBT7469719.1 hypothetical protein [Candidatus Cloacimonadota bacterium]